LETPGAERDRETERKGKMLLVPMEDPSAARGRLLYLIFIFVLFVMLSPNSPDPYRLLAVEDQAAREKHSLDVLTNATFQAPFTVPASFNVTGVITCSSQPPALTFS